MSNSEILFVKGDNKDMDFDVFNINNNNNNNNNISDLVQFQEYQCSSCTIDDSDHHQTHSINLQNQEPEQPVTICEEKDRDQSLLEFNATVVEKGGANNNEEGVNYNHDDDDGFKTPTSLQHKIPVITECPPAPSKSKLSPLIDSRKRTFSSSQVICDGDGDRNARRTLVLDVSEEIESMFPRQILHDLHNKIKKAKRESYESKCNNNSESMSIN